MSAHGAVLVPCDASLKRFRGFVRGGGNRQYAIEVELPSENVPKSRLHVCGELLELIRGYASTVQTQLEHARDATALSRTFVPFLQRLVQSQCGASNQQSADSHDWTAAARVVAELEQLGWEHVAAVGHGLQRLELHHVDAAGRKHLMSLTLPADYPRSAPAIATALPEVLELPWSPATSLRDVYAVFVAAVSRYQRLWDMLVELYATVRILEPPQLDYRSTSCRVALQKNVSLQLQLDVRDPTQLPDVRFLGPEHATRPLEALFAKNASLWSRQQSVWQNMCTLLEADLALPPADASALADNPPECGVCYTYKLGDELPDKICEEPRCARPFHTSCLAEWLRSLQETRQSFDTLFGECPYCNTAISVRLSKG